MTEQTPPAWLQAGSYPAEDDRRLIETIFASSEGVILGDDLEVTQRGAGANMSVDVAGGRCVIKGDLSTYEGSYFMENRGVTNLVIAAADPTNDRIDRVIAEVLNSEYSGASNLWQLRVMTGTPAGSPVAPTLPDNAISLATVQVDNLQASVVDADITDTRTRAWIGNGTIICTSTTRPSSPFEGMEIYETDTDKNYIYDGTTWRKFGDGGSWTSYTPSWLQSVAITKTVTIAKYRHIGRSMKGVVFMTATSAGTASQAIVVTIPGGGTIAPAWTNNAIIGQGILTTGAINIPIMVQLAATSGGQFMFIPANTASANFLGTGAFYYTSGAGANTLFTPTVASGWSIIFDFDYETLNAASV